MAIVYCREANRNWLAITMQLSAPHYLLGVQVAATYGPLLMWGNFHLSVYLEQH